MSKIRIITDGLMFPEGPIAMPDGSVILVEIGRGTLTRVFPDGKKEIVAEPGDGPNGAAIGPDGHCYVCNNGGFAFERGPRSGNMRSIGQSADYKTGRIERIDLKTGKVERLYDSCNGRQLKGPNDIVFDRNGGFWFTDLGKVRERETDRGAVYYAKSDGSMIKEVIQPFLTPNGIGLSPDEKTLYVAETETGRLWSYPITGEGEVSKVDFPPSLNGGSLVSAEAGWRRFDSLALEENGNICVATLMTGGITVASPNGGMVEFFETGDPYTTNVCFGGPDLKTAYMTLSWAGQLAAVDWPRAGLRLNFLNR
ncbi:SMP-30/gluconolactonase/LRE family protein [Nisaea sp.]|uniref:SMP-30/gluconolactonase/LRE family protein n=1 Tax=Nisaea sp. TaxID=2024842 RepID=UPI002B265387|nr:SMP-30/gluconolactonase/LRE family protein [Nisaea sp.]